MTDPQTVDEAYVALLLERLSDSRQKKTSADADFQTEARISRRRLDLLITIASRLSTSYDYKSPERLVDRVLEVIGEANQASSLRQQLEAQDLAAKARHSLVARTLGLADTADWALVENRLEAVGKLLRDLAGDEGDILAAGSGGLVAAAATGLQVRGRLCEKYQRLATEVAAVMGLEVDIAQDSDFGVLLRTLGLVGALLRRIVSRPTGLLVASAEAEYDQLVGSRAIQADIIGSVCEALGLDSSATLDADTICQAVAKLRADSDALGRVAMLLGAQKGEPTVGVTCDLTVAAKDREAMIAKLNSTLNATIAEANDKQRGLDKIASCLGTTTDGIVGAIQTLQYPLSATYRETLLKLNNALMLPPDAQLPEVLRAVIERLDHAERQRKKTTLNLRLLADQLRLPAPASLSHLAEIVKDRPIDDAAGADVSVSHQ